MNETKAIEILTTLCNSWRNGSVMLESKDYGLIAADTLACIQLENMEAEKNNPVLHMESFLSSESRSVQEFFVSLGFKF